MPDASGKLLSGELDAFPTYEHSLNLPAALLPLFLTKFGPKFRFACQQMWYYRQLLRMGDGESPHLEWSPLFCLQPVATHDRLQASRLQGMNTTRRLWAPFDGIAKKAALYLAAVVVAWSLAKRLL